MDEGEEDDGLWGLDEPVEKEEEVGALDEEANDMAGSTTLMLSPEEERDILWLEGMVRGDQPSEPEASQARWSPAAAMGVPPSFYAAAPAPRQIYA